MGSGTREIKLVVPSRIESLAFINAVAEEVADQMKFDEEARNAITISVVEAGTNAIQHGNKEDETLPTEVLFRQEDGQLVILIRDAGLGFDPERIADPMAEENMFAESGRGVYILRSFMDEVAFSFRDGVGTECRLVKVLSQPARPSNG
ncbi:MAG: anti-sigma regulatory factor [Gemmatimonadota bacterium]|nr:MAG: anti-sigma regulatory factor [Gemmatimonadota bacterium]